MMLTFIRLPAVRLGDRKPTISRKQRALRPDHRLHMRRSFTIILRLHKPSSPFKIRTGTHTHTMGIPHSHRQPQHHNLKNRQLHHLRRRETFPTLTRRRRTFSKLSILGICCSYPPRKRTMALRQTSRLLRIIMFQRCQHRRLMFLLSNHTRAQSFKRNWRCWWHS